MAWKFMMFAMMLLMLPQGLHAGEDGKVRELKVKGLKVGVAKGKINEPRVIASIADLEKAFADTDALKKEVDFSKEKLLLFAWGGSGGDKLAGKIDKEGKTVVFTVTRGLTCDYRQHVHLYAIPKDAEFKVMDAAR